MSGAHGAPTWDQNDKNVVSFVKPSVARVYGTIDNPVRASNDLTKLLNELTPERTAQLPFLYLDCGTEDFLIDSNRALAELLLKRKIPHEFRELPGTHSWPYWDQQIQEVLKLAARKLATPQTSAVAGR